MKIYYVVVGVRISEKLEGMMYVIVGVRISEKLLEENLIVEGWIQGGRKVQSLKVEFKVT